MGTRLVSTSRSSGGDSGDERMYGKLGSVSLNDILQLLGMTQRTATVRLDCRGQKGLIYFRDGVLLHATAGSAEGERALVKIMSWKSADFIIEDGLEGNPPGTISKKVDAAILDVMTRLDEGWYPEMTPFPMLDRVTTSPAVLDRKVRFAARKPPLPRRATGRRKRIVAAAIAAPVLGAAATGLFLDYRSTDLGDLPTISGVPTLEAPPEDQGVASDVLRTAIDGRRNDGIAILAAHGVSFSPIPESGRRVRSRRRPTARRPPPPRSRKPCLEPRSSASSWSSPSPGPRWWSTGSRKAKHRSPRCVFLPGAT